MAHQTDDEQADLAERQRQLEAVFEAPGTFIGVLDPDGTLLRANQVAMELAGTDPDEYIGRSFSDGPWFDHDDVLQEQVADAVERASTGNTVEFDATHVDLAGDVIDVAVTISPVRDDDEDIVDSEAARVGKMDETVTVETSVAGNPTVSADDLLTDVVGNILTNAVEHNDTDAPHIWVTVEAPEDDQMVTIRVTDDGPGIPDSEKRRVLNRGETGRQSGGTGFGMYFANSMVEAYGGSVTIEDNDPRGAIVSIEIPRS